MPRLDDDPGPLPAAVLAPSDQALALTGGDTGAAILLALHKLNEVDDVARVRGAWMRRFHRNIGSRRPRRRPAGP
jgi:hypothetical protein